MRVSSIAVRLVAAATLAGGALAGCAIIGSDSEPRAVEDLPDDLFPTTTSTTAPEAPQYELPVFFINGNDQLMMFTRERETPPSIQEALDGLADANDDEREAEPTISSKLFPDMMPEGTLTDGTLQIHVAGPQLRDATETGQADRVRLIFSQIVCTVFALDQGVERVHIVDDEVEDKGPIRVPLPGGEVVDRPVAPNDFNDCLTAEDEAAAAEGEGEGEGDTSTSTAPSGGDIGPGIG